MPSLDAATNGQVHHAHGYSKDSELSYPNGHITGKGDKFVDREHETAELLRAVEGLLLPFIGNAEKDRVEDDPDQDSLLKAKPLKKRALLKEATPSRVPGPHDALGSDELVRPFTPHELMGRLEFELPEKGQGMEGLVAIVDKLLQYSVNTWHQGFMHKLYATTNPIGVVSELILATLNTALHVYKVSPALSVIERLTSKKLANRFGLTGPHAGGGTHPGGSASNMAAMVIARNTHFPDIKTDGNANHNLVVFTSVDSHYSVKKAAQTLGIGARSVWGVPVDDEGKMQTAVLQDMISQARSQGYKPFFVNATAGTTVLGAVDPLHEIADICEREHLWMHADASWGGAAVFTENHRWKLDGIERARSITTNPHKMLGVPVTCSFLLAADMRVFWQANRIDAGYLFHSSNTEDDDEVSWDLADATLQCGRRGDSLKLALAWIYRGREGLGAYVENGFNKAAYLAQLVEAHPDLILASTNPPPAMQVCFYHQPDRSGSVKSMTPDEVTAHTHNICEQMETHGFMIDHAPGPDGHFIRVALNGETTDETIERLVNAVISCHAEQA